jgi:hypothetical protein
VSPVPETSCCRCLTLISLDPLGRLRLKVHRRSHQYTNEERCSFPFAGVIIGGVTNHRCRREAVACFAPPRSQIGHRAQILCTTCSSRHGRGCMQADWAINSAIERRGGGGNPCPLYRTHSTRPMRPLRPEQQQRRSAHQLGHILCDRQGISTTGEILDFCQGDRFADR